MTTTTIELSSVIKDIAAGPFGSNLKVSCFVDDGFPIIDGANLKGLKVTDNITKYVTEEKARSLHRAIAKRGDVVVTISGTLGQIAYIPQNSRYEEYLVSQRQFRVTFDESKVSVPYLVYYFHTFEGQNKILAFASQVGVPALSQPLKNFRQITLNLPPLEIQQKIANMMDSITDKIENNRAINNNLEQQAKALYHQMFVASSSPEWTHGTLSDIADITMGQSPSGSSYNEDGIGTVFYQGRAEFGYRFPTQRLCTTEPKRMARENDVLMSVRAPVGDLNVAREDCCIGRGLASIRSRNNRQSFVLYTVFALQPELDKFNGEGTVFGSINRDSLNKMAIEIPTDDEMDRFESLVSPMDAQIRANHEEVLRLEAIREALLPKLMSGDLDVSEIEI